MPVAAREVRKDSVRPGMLGLGAVPISLRYGWTLRRRLRELQPDIVHTNSLKAALYGGVAGRLAGIPVIWHVRDRIAPDYLPAAAVRMVRLGVAPPPEAVIANSQRYAGDAAGLPSGRRRHQHRRVRPDSKSRTSGSDQARSVPGRDHRTSRPLERAGRLPGGLRTRLPRR